MISLDALAQNNSYSVSTDEKNGSQVFNGPVTFNDLDKEASFTWLKSGNEAYNPKEKRISFLDEHLKKYSMVIFLGTWCADSKALIPKLEKVLEVTKYPKSQITMYGVDRDKNTKGGEEKKYDISFVPTIILLDNGKEIGRITETVTKSVETDLERMINKYEKTTAK